MYNYFNVWVMLLLIVAGCTIFYGIGFLFSRLNSHLNMKVARKEKEKDDRHLIEILNIVKGAISDMDKLKRMDKEAPNKEGGGKV